MRSAEARRSRALLQDEVSAAVLGPGLLGVAGVGGALLAVADGVHPVGADPLRNQVLLGRVRAPVTERQVVLLGAPFVAVTLDREPDARALSERPRILVERGTSVVA